MGLKFWKKEPHDIDITAVILRKENKDLHGFLQVVKENVRPKAFDMPNYVINKANNNIEIIGGARLGKTSLAELFTIRLKPRKIIISFKKFLPTRRDFDIGYTWIDVSECLPNFWDDSQSAIEAFGTAFFAEADVKGLMIDTVKTKYAEIMAQNPKSFAEFFKKLKEIAGDDWDIKITNLIEGKIRLLEKATSNAKIGSVNFGEGNIVLDFGNLANKEVKTFFAEYYIRQIARIEEAEQRAEKICIVIDEAWHLLQNTQQQSKIGELLLQGAYYIQLIIITQNFCHLDTDYRGHFGTIFCFHNSNDEDMIAIANAHGAYLRDGVRLLSDYEFVDLKYEHSEGIIPVFKLNYENFQIAKLEAKAKSILQGESAVFEEKKEQKVEEPDYVNDGNNTWKPEQKAKFDRAKVEPQIISTIWDSEQGLWQNEVLVKIGFGRNNPQRLTASKLMDKMVDEEKIRVVEYVTPRLERGQKPRRLWIDGKSKDRAETQLHRRELGDCKTIFRDKIKFLEGKTNQGYDFTLDNFYIECETGFKNEIDSFNFKIEQADKKIIVVVPNEKERENYSFMPVARLPEKCRIVLLNELAEVMAVWQ